jgi:hypothetical protein
MQRHKKSLKVAGKKDLLTNGPTINMQAERTEYMKPKSATEA